MNVDAAYREMLAADVVALHRRLQQDQIRLDVIPGAMLRLSDRYEVTRRTLLSLLAVGFRSRFAGTGTSLFDDRALTYLNLYVPAPHQVRAWNYNAGFATALSNVNRPLNVPILRFFAEGEEGRIRINVNIDAVNMRWYRSGHRLVQIWELLKHTYALIQQIEPVAQQYITVRSQAQPARPHLRIRAPGEL